MPKVVDHLDLKSLAPGQHHFWLNLLPNSMGGQTQIPVMVLKGEQPGPVVGITSAIHGNELNGIPVIQKLFETVTPSNLKGTILAVPVMNVRGFQENKRLFDNHDGYRDGMDLNHLMDGRLNQGEAGMYAQELVEKIVDQCDYIFDLHGNGLGREGLNYIYADKSNADSWKMALNCRPDVIINIASKAKKHTVMPLMRIANKKYIPAITIEIGQACVFEPKRINRASHGLLNALNEIRMLKQPLADYDQLSKKTKITNSELFVSTLKKGGLLTVKSRLGEFIPKNTPVAELKDVFGENVETIRSPFEGIVVFRSTNPVAAPGKLVLSVAPVAEEVQHSSVGGTGK
ncbi:MAG: succinylglutamate desuccinylase/aspartoacylase family protein [Vampirovibrio sp.]|nr:succinylglutamate desuccinylase/aspartoacylase family protein [Vampirovibrio sp.]